MVKESGMALRQVGGLWGWLPLCSCPVCKQRDRMSLSEQGDCRAEGMAPLWGEMVVFRSVNVLLSL